MKTLVYYMHKGKVQTFQEIDLDDETNEGVFLMRIVSDLGDREFCAKIGARPLKIMDRLSIGDKFFEYNGRCFNEI